MFNFINLKKITATSLLAILLTGFVFAQPSNAGKKKTENTNSSGQQETAGCKNNNGSGNNDEIEYTIGNETRTIQIDPGNKGQMSKFESGLAAEGFSQAQIDNAVAQLWDAEKTAKGGGKQCKADITVTIEAPEIQEPQLSNPNDYFVVDFDDVNTGTNIFTVEMEGTNYEYSSDLEVKTANQWGGAGSSKFITQAVKQSIRSYKINIDEEQKYFGFWWSAGDPYNKITFKKGNQEVATFKTEDLVNFINSSGVENTQAYYGNPAYSGANNGHQNEPFSFVNVFFNEGGYDEIIVETLTAGGSAFESDNHTFSAKKQMVRGTNIVAQVFAD